MWPQKAEFLSLRQVLAVQSKILVENTYPRLNLDNKPKFYKEAYRRFYIQEQIFWLSNAIETFSIPR